MLQWGLKVHNDLKPRIFNVQKLLREFTPTTCQRHNGNEKNSYHYLPLSWPLLIKLHLWTHNWLNQCKNSLCINTHSLFRATLLVFIIKFFLKFSYIYQLIKQSPAILNKNFWTFLCRNLNAIFQGQILSLNFCCLIIELESRFYWSWATRRMFTGRFLNYSDLARTVRNSFLIFSEADFILPMQHALMFENILVQIPLIWRKGVTNYHNLIKKNNTQNFTLQVKIAKPGNFIHTAHQRST